jgi:hypothetical protein
VPLPGTLPLFASGLGVMGWLVWRKKRKPVALASIDLPHFEYGPTPSLSARPVFRVSWLRARVTRREGSGLQ